MYFKASHAPLSVFTDLHADMSAYSFACIEPGMRKSPNKSSITSHTDSIATFCELNTMSFCPC